jgi:hypothetical protein
MRKREIDGIVIYQDTESEIKPVKTDSYRDRFLNQNGL